MSQFYQKPDKEPTAPSGGGKRAIKKRWFFPQITGKKRIALYAYSALTVFAAIIVVGYIAFEAFSAPPEIPVADNTRPPRPSVEVPEGEDPNNPDIIEPIPDLSNDRREQFYTFLLVGQSQEEGGSLTDTMMMASYDVPNQTLKVMNLPRDIYVSRKGRRMLLNAVYNWCGGGDSGKDGLKEEVRKLTGIPIDFFVLVQWEAFGELVDAIGGVYFDVPRDMKYSDPEQDLYIDVRAGYQLLDGSKAMQVVRFREGANGYIDGDLGRIRTQQSFMKALVKKCLEPGVLLTHLTEYIEIFQKNVTTDLAVSDLTYFAKSAVGGLDMDNVSFVTMPNKSAPNGHLYPDAKAIVELINDGFNPYWDAIELWELTVESGSSSSGSSGSSGTTSTPTPSATPTPSTTPSESPEPTGSPSASPSPSGSPNPSDTSGPVGPTASTRPSQSPDPEGSESPAQGTETPVLTPPPMESPEPTPTETSEEAPVLPSNPVG